MDKIRNYFKNYPESNECFVSSDEFIFHKKHDATAHGNMLDKKGVLKVTREQIETIETDIDQAEETDPGEIKKTDLKNQEKKVAGKLAKAMKEKLATLSDDEKKKISDKAFSSFEDALTKVSDSIDQNTKQEEAPAVNSAIISESEGKEDSQTEKEEENELT